MAVSVSQADIEQPLTTIGSLEFVQDLPIYATEQPYEVVGTLPAEQECMRSNVKFEIHEVPILDLRQNLSTVSFDTHGFEIVKEPGLSGFNLADDEQMKDYLLGIVELLKTRFDAEEVVVYNYNVQYPKHKPSTPC